MDLFQTLMNRELTNQPVPAVPPNPTKHLPTKSQRFVNAQQLMQSYRDGWQPNPILLQATQK